MYMITPTQGMQCIENHFYVDNWLQSFPTPDTAKDVTDKLRELLLEGGFELRQWDSSMPDVISHLPREIRSESSEQLLNHTDMDPQEPALGFVGYATRIHCCKQ